MQIFFKNKKTQYLTIARKVMVNESLAILKSAKGNKSKIKAALKKLKTAPLNGATSSEKLNIQKNRLEIATQLKDLNEVNSAALAILQNENHTTQDKESAQEKRLWVAESKLHFKTALNIAKKNEFP